MKPLQKPDLITHNTTVQRLIIKDQPGVYQNASSGKSVATQKNYLIIKRFFDILFSAFIISLILSWLLPIIGLLIKLDSKGPAFFKQKRIGLNGKPFMCLKLRTMILNNEADESQARENDYRITRLGLFLRQTNLDELPQFFNVLAGQMSIVGPRPHMVADCIRFSFVISSYPFRHFVKPGITGWAQVMGYHGPTMDYESIINRYHWDAKYVRQAGLWLDIKIIVLTITRSIYQFSAGCFRFLMPNDKQTSNPQLPS